MELALIDLVTSGYFLLFLAVSIGFLVGRVKIKGISLGMSGALFTGLVIGWLVYDKYAAPYKDDFEQGKYSEIPQESLSILEQGIVSADLFYLFLFFFLAAVGLLASENISKVLKKFGLKFIFLGFSITFVGAAVCYLMVLALPGQDPFALSGVYTGALTSSPGLGAAIEAVEVHGKEAQALVGAGHAIGYPFGVMIVILAIHLFPRFCKINIEKEKSKYVEEISSLNSFSSQHKNSSSKIDVLAFGFTCLLGYLVGSISINLGTLGDFALGSSGGVLIASLFLGYCGKIGFLNFRMDAKVLEAVRDISGGFFLAVVGLRYGFLAFDTLLTGGFYIAFVSVVTAFTAVLTGFLIGHYIFKINWILLSGALCGGMTSTPGLGITVEALRSNAPATGYGLIYPFSLLGVVIFTILLHNLPI